MKLATVGPWLVIGAAASLLIVLALWTAQGASAGRDAGAAIVQAQRDVGAVQDVHVEVDPAALRDAEADLLTATTAFNRADYATASEFALRASRIAQDLLASRRLAEEHEIRAD
jgi:hypothetical protein